MADNAPLRELIRETFTREFLDEIAEQHARGRILLVGTSNLDARRPVIWNLTKVAASDDPRALTLFHDVLAASSAIPGAFPPLMLDVVCDGQRYQEMHVDGGAFSQVFVYPPSLHLEEEAEEHHVERERTLYVVRNSQLVPDWSEVERRTLSIAGRAIASLIQTQGIGDLFRIYVLAERDEVDFNLAYIPDDFDAPHPEPFDTTYMRALFEVGYERGVAGGEWVQAPPGME
jgi:predicted acylesterase/phospholipase RssA